MAKGKITKQSVDAAKPGAKDVILWDERLAGFGLKVTPAGAKSYLFQYRLGGRAGKTRRVTIGKHGVYTPDGARREAERLSQLVAQGTDPQQQRTDAARKAIDLAFSPYADTFVTDCLKVRWKSSHAEGDALLRLYAKPTLGDKPLHEITRADIRAVLKKVDGKVATTRNLFGVLRRLFRWAVSEGDIDRSPLDGMEPPPLAPARDRVLSDSELLLVWQASKTLGYPFGPMVRLLALTGQRLREVSDMEWSELHRDSRTWMIPGPRAKNNVASLVPLSTQVVAELDELAAKKGKGGEWPRTGYVFTTTGETPASGYSKAKKRIDAKVVELAKDTDLQLTFAPWRFHDLRRTLATGLQRLGVRFEVTEAVLNHVSGSKSGVAGVYQRHDWASEKRVALQAWADHVMGLLVPSDETNVVSLPARIA